MGPSLGIGLGLSVGGAPRAGLPTPVVVTNFPIGNSGVQQPNVHVRDITNGFDLYTRQADTVHDYAGSSTKLMTILLAWEYLSAVWTNTVTLTVADVTQPMPPFTLDMAGFQTNDVVTYEGLAYALLLASSTEACLAFARVIGNMIYAAAGNTGTQGVTRFVERMNSRSAELGMTNTVYENPYGGSRTPSPDTIRNRITARDLSTVCEAAMSVAALRAIANTVTFGVNVTGGRTTTVTVNNYNRFVNGPTLVQAGVKNANVVGGKNGVWTVSGVDSYTLSQVVTSPNGTEVVVTVLGSVSLIGLQWDVHGLMLALCRDFPYLAAGAAAPTDALFASVKALFGFDGSTAEESSGRPVTVSQFALAGSGLVNGSTGKATNADVNGYVSVPDSPDFDPNAGGLCVEFYFAGAGTEPGTEQVFTAKAVAASRSWLLNYFGPTLTIFVSTDGANWASSSYAVAANDRGTLFNGAIRHFALQKSGNVWRLFICGELFLTHNAAAAPANGTAPLSIGYTEVANAAPLGAIDEYRLTMNARYATAGFTVDPRKFPRS